MESVCGESDSYDIICPGISWGWWPGISPLLGGPGNNNWCFMRLCLKGWRTCGAYIALVRANIPSFTSVVDGWKGVLVDLHWENLVDLCSQVCRESSDFTQTTLIFFEKGFLSNVCSFLDRIQGILVHPGSSRDWKYCPVHYTLIWGFLCWYRGSKRKWRFMRRYSNDVF